MPQYKVIAPGFYNGKMYNPEGKRNVLYTDKPFSKKEPMPTWLATMPQESEGVRLKREAREAQQAENDAEKSAQDEKDITNASFMGVGESGVVETL